MRCDAECCYAEILSGQQSKRFIDISLMMAAVATRGILVLQNCIIFLLAAGLG
jgi:hypothetical protein